MIIKITSFYLITFETVASRAAVFIQRAGRRVSNETSLSDMRIGQSGVITSFDREAVARGPLSTLPADDVIRRIVELGMTLNAKVTVKHFGPINRSPIAIEVRGATIAIGRDEAEAVKIRMDLK